MSRENVSTPARGETWYGGRTIDTANLEAVELEGQSKVFEDISWSDRGIKSARSARKVECMLVRNYSGVTIYGKELVKVDPSTGRITGLAATTATECFPVDEFLPATGVPHGDLCWVVVSGPAMCKTPMNGADFSTASISVGDRIVSLTTAGASTAAGTTASAGRVAGFSIVAATTVAQFTDLLNAANNMVGKAMSAATSGQTNADLLVDVGRPRNIW